VNHRHVPRLIAIALACAGAVLGASPAPATDAASRSRRPLVVAHRGGALLLPENTVPAFDNAVRLGVDMLEFDMQMTADNQLVISHDGSVNPTFCTADPGSGVKPGPVRAMTLADVLKFDCGSRHRAIYPTQKAVPGTPMPTPDAFFARYRNSRAQFFGETKMPGPGEGDVDPVAFARLVAAAVRRYGLEDRFILQSFDYRTIDAMHEINPRIRTCLLGVWRAQTDYLELARAHHAMCMLLRLQDADAAQVRRLREAGVQIFSDVVDDEAGWRDYLARGADALFTNDPAGLIAFLNRDGAAN
jgi:glycerophosphoryl diester phosphodiesterase